MWLNGFGYSLRWFPFSRKRRGGEKESKFLSKIKEEAPVCFIVCLNERKVPA